MSILRNYQYITKKYLYELLKERYKSNEKMIDRLSYNLVTEDDVKDFVKIVTDAFEIGYLKAVNDYKDQLRKLGYNVEIVPEKKK